MKWPMIPFVDYEYEEELRERIAQLEAAIRHVWDDTEETTIDAEYLADFQVEMRAAWDACCKLGDK